MTDRCTACPQRSPFPDGNGDFCRLEGAPCVAVAAACAERHRFVPTARHYPSRMIVRCVDAGGPRIDPDLQRLADDEEEDDYTPFPPKRRYTGRIQIRDRYRAVPVSSPDELSD